VSASSEYVVAGTSSNTSSKRGPKRGSEASIVWNNYRQSFVSACYSGCLPSPSHRKDTITQSSALHACSTFWFTTPWWPSCHPSCPLHAANSDHTTLLLRLALGERSTLFVEPYCPAGEPPHACLSCGPPTPVCHVTSDSVPVCYVTSFARVCHTAPLQSSGGR
jgi:hypothetical protein